MRVFAVLAQADMKIGYSSKALQLFVYCKFFLVNFNTSRS